VGSYIFIRAADTVIGPFKFSAPLTDLKIGPQIQKALHPKPFPIRGKQYVPGFSLCIFGSLTCLRNLFSAKGDLLRWKVPARLRKVPASLSLFLKSEKTPALLYVGKGYKPLRT
jgi:hypothetical protein